MKKILLYFSFVLLAFNIFTVNVFADEKHLGEDGSLTVTFQSNKEFDNKSYEETIAKELKDLQPGDSVSITYTLKNEYNEPVTWYLSNDATNLFEDDTRSEVAGGNYSYKLIYVDGFNTEKVIYDSDSVGGDTLTGDKEGLSGATNSIGGKPTDSEGKTDYIKLDTINSGETTKLTMSFALDGETQANNYQDVLGKLRVRFGVELNAKEKEKPEPKIIEKKDAKHTTKYLKRKVYIPFTGDNLSVSYFAIAEVVLLTILVVLIIKYRQYLKRQEER